MSDLLMIISNFGFCAIAIVAIWQWHKADERAVRWRGQREKLAAQISRNNMHYWKRLAGLYHHLRKANKGNRRQNRLVKRERREKEALVALLEMDGGKVRFNPSPEVGVLVLYPESLEMFETPDVGEEVVV